MKIEEMLKQIGQQICVALNEQDEEIRVENKYILLGQLEGLIAISKSRDNMLLTTAALLDNANKGEVNELTTLMRQMVFDN